MQFTTVSLVATLATLASAAIVEFYTDGNCQNSYGSRNIYDNTCATGVGAFQSYKVTTAGGSSQALTPWNRDACAGPKADSSWATDVGTCYGLAGQQASWNGDANAMSSYSA